ncbi:MAG: hypothetical protein KIS67_16370 [Verrucomicrobiae bacterium]|nr:hypothetical protein [Verrucomicrobiae bacterium]
MARNPELEAILLARYELETCDPRRKTEHRAKLDALLEAAVAKSGSRSLTRRTLIEITAEAYQEFKLARKKAERSCLSRVR